MTNLSLFRRLVFLVPIYLISFCNAAEFRSWQNIDGTKSFSAEFVSRKSNDVTLRRVDGKELTFSIEKLHASDQTWLNQKHPADGSEPLPSKNAVFDTLEFGDSRSEVSEKLKSSKMVGTAVAGTFFGRTGLNGIYHTNQKIGGLYCYLFFDWSENGTLKEITLRTEAKNSQQYSSILQPCWQELITLISPIHGKPLQHMRIAKSKELEEGQMLATHLWEIETGGTVLLGTSKSGNAFEVAVRFTQDDIQVNRIEP